jgi:transcriptional regulator with XRE-family HTH domain
MYVAERLRQVREAKKLSQGDVEKRTGLLRCYISRVENGHTVPAVETLEKLARALEIPLYQLLYDGDGLPPITQFPQRSEPPEWGESGKNARYLRRLRHCLAHMSPEDRNLIMFTLTKMSKLAKRNS